MNSILKGKYSLQHWGRQKFLRTQKALNKKERYDMFDLIKIKISAYHKTPLKNGRPLSGEDICNACFWQMVCI